MTLSHDNATPAPAPAAAPRGIGVLKTRDLRAGLLRGVHVLPGQGNTLAVETRRGVIVVDAGPGGGTSARMIAHLRGLTDAPLSHIVYSHGHAGYNHGVQAWLDDARSRGHPRPAIVGHAGVAARYQRYLATSGLQALLNGWQFRGPLPEVTPAQMIVPDLSFEERLVIDGGERTVELLAAPSETDDAIALWLPAERFLYGGAAVIRSLPNVGTPLRTWRDPLRWADTLERLAALRPAVLLGEFGSPITDPQEIDELFRVTIAGLRWLRVQVVERMNRGMHVDDIVHDLEYPPAIFGHRFMRPIYGAPDFIVRDIWRSENGWWDRNPSTLHPAAPDEVAADLRDAIGDPQAVIERALALAQQGDTQLALHVLDLVALQLEGARGQVQATELKADLACRRATEVSSVVSRNLYRSGAERLRGQPLGSTRETDPTGDFSWG